MLCLASLVFKNTTVLRLSSITIASRHLSTYASAARSPTASEAHQDLLETCRAIRPPNGSVLRIAQQSSLSRTASSHQLLRVA